MWMEIDGRPSGDKAPAICNTCGMAASDGAAASCVLAVRSPTRDAPELVISRRGHRADVVGLTYTQSKHLAYEFARIVAEWPDK